MVHGHPVKYRAKNLAGACHGFLKKFLELIVHRTAVLTVRIHLPPGESPRLILPVFTQTVPGPFLSFPQEMFLVIVSVGLYCAFLAMQMRRHRGYFTLGERIVEQPLRESASTPVLFTRVALLIAYLVLVVF